MLTLQKETGFSPEQLARRLGVSGMTVRRWRRHPPDKDLPPLYAKAFSGVVSELASEGKLSLSSSSVRAVVAEQKSVPSYTVSNQLGLSKGILQGAKYDPKKVLENLSKIGTNEFKKAEVHKSEKEILSFKKMGADWANRISCLMTVLKSEEFHSFDRLVAYGALFYLINPFDLIPDYIPVFGYMDDYFILGLAAAYYLKRFPHLLGKRH